MTSITLSCAMSLDGFLDDRSEKPLALSSAEDFAAMYRLRAEHDVIVIGANTLRNDNPSLATRHDDCLALRAAAGRDRDPIKVVVSRSGVLPTSAQFFTTGDAEKIILTTHGDVASLRTRYPGATIESSTNDWVSALRRLTAARGKTDIMIEGGASILRQAIRSGAVTRWRLAIAPVLLGDAGRAALFDAADPITQRMTTLAFENARLVGGTLVADVRL